MGKCGAFLSTITRMGLYATVLVSTAATLWGMISSQGKNSSTCWLGGSTCLLFGSVSSNTTRCGVSRLHMPSSGGVASCHYIIYYGAAQLFAVLCLCVLSVAVARGRKDGHNTESWRRFAKFGEVIGVLVLVLCSLAAAIMLSIGFAMFCHEMKKNWRSEPSDLVSANQSSVAHHTAKSCSSTYLFKDVNVQFNTTGHGTYTSSFKKVSFHHYYYIAQIAAWVSFLVWLAHLAISVSAFRRRPATEELPYTLRPSDSLTSLDDDLLT